MAAPHPFRITDSVANFFKVILQSTLDNQKLLMKLRTNIMILSKLRNNIRTLISEHYDLFVPSGDVWRVSLERDHTLIHFVREWKTFAEHYFLTDGQFVIFNYQGSSIFHARILDFSCCEIKYPRVFGQIKQEEIVEEDVCEAIHSSGKGKGKCVDPHAMRKRKNIAIAKRFKRSKLMLQRMRSSHANPIRKNHYVKMFVENISEYTYPHQKAKIPKEREKLIRATKMFKLEKPFFAVMLGQSNYDQLYMYVPKAYFLSYMRGSTKYIKIVDSDEKQWDTKCTYAKYSRVRIGKGCAKFFKGNDLKNGDVCLFELINKKDVVLKFSVLRAAEYAVNPDMAPQKMKKSEIRNRGALYISKKINQVVKSRETKKAMNAAKAFRFNHPAFMVILRDYMFTNSLVYVPQEFANDHLLRSDGCGCNINLRASSGEEWPVLCTYDLVRCVMKIHNGFTQFCKGNNLKPGDVCVFELIKNKPAEFKVSVFFASNYAS